MQSPKYCVLQFLFREPALNSIEIMHPRTEREVPFHFWVVPGILIFFTSISIDFTFCNCFIDGALSFYLYCFWFTLSER